MSEDEEEIRDLPVKWMAATRSGDIDALMDLMTEDALFLTPGNAPMVRELFRKIASGQSGEGMPEFAAESEVQEVKVLGDHAFMWTKLRVTVTPREGEPVARSGHTLTILRKENGKWRLARDANLLVTESR
ncbi:MAG: SgcJ/EcaC family oxidoreductase [Verrucomicrobiaceae bacterium]|nr:MAG: SgcJ/EcaC family oxidoreductase [Verrucomicrobiaceae bacterium]